MGWQKEGSVTTGAFGSRDRTSPGPSRLRAGLGHVNSSKAELPPPLNLWLSPASLPKSLTCYVWGRLLGKSPPDSWKAGLLSKEIGAVTPAPPAHPDV